MRAATVTKQLNISNNREGTIEFPEQANNGSGEQWVKENNNKGTIRFSIQANNGL